MNRNILLLALLVTFVFGCKGSNKRDIETILSEMKSQPIDLCLDRMVCRYENRDTCISDEQCYDYKMVMYMDSTECSPCRINDLYLWNDYVDRKPSKTKFYFIFSIKKVDVVCTVEGELDFMGVKIKGAYKKGSSHSIAWARYNCKPNEVTHTGCCTKSGLYSGEKKLA